MTLRLTGPGSGEVRLLGDQSDAAQIILDGTTEASKLVISVAGGLCGQTTVYDLDVNGSLGMLIAPNVDIIHDVLVTEQIGKMRIDEFVGAAPQNITIRGESDRLRDAFILAASNPNDVTIDAGVPVITIDLDGPFKTTTRKHDGPSFLRDLACTHRFRIREGLAIAN